MCACVTCDQVVASTRGSDARGCCLWLVNRLVYVRVTTFDCPNRLCTARLPAHRLPAHVKQMFKWVWNLVQRPDVVDYLERAVIVDEMTHDFLLLRGCVESRAFV